MALQHECMCVCMCMFTSEQMEYLHTGIHTHKNGRPRRWIVMGEGGQQKRRRAFWSCITDYWALMETAIC